MRILFVSPIPLLRTLGAPKVLIEIAAAMGRLGWECKSIQPSDVGIDSIPDEAARIEMMGRFRDYVRAHAAEFDVVEYDHAYLPFTRDQFPAEPLLVARSVLLVQHFDSIRLPRPLNPRSLAGLLLREPQRRRIQRERSARADLGVRNADLVNVCNGHDRAELLRRGVDPAKIFVAPFGMEESRRLLFDRVPAEPPTSPLVGFVGSFDFRKGALEFGRLAGAILRAVPDARFRLVGTDGLHKGEQQVLAFFPRAIRPRIEVIPKFAPDDLPWHLGGVSVGVFPSYVEGFPFGVLEMLAAAVPVVAYDSPGPPMMLPPERLVPRGNYRAMAGKVVALLANVPELTRARIAARESSRKFNWDEVARDTAAAYAAAIERVR